MLGCARSRGGANARASLAKGAGLPVHNLKEQNATLLKLLEQAGIDYERQDIAASVQTVLTNELQPRAKVPLLIGADFESRAQQAVTHPWLNDPDHKLFVTAGRLVPIKDHETLLRAMALYRRNNNGRLLILGSGPLEASLRALTQDLDLQEAVDFLGYQGNPLPYFRHADAFVLSSYAEGFGNVLVEAMGCGTPVIATNCEHGPAEILDGGRYGVLVEPRNAQALADAMERVFELSHCWPNTLLQSRASTFSTASCTSAYLQLIQSVASSTAGRSPDIADDDNTVRRGLHARSV